MDDMIRRQDAINAMCELIHHWFGGDPKDEVREINRELGKLPSAQPEQAIKDCRNCKHGKYNDHHKTMFCYNSDDCTDWNLWEPAGLPSAQQWIPVTERLPKESDGKVLITVSGEVEIGKYSEFSKTWFIGGLCGVGGDDPIAWMPLPEPWEGRE